MFVVYCRASNSESGREDLGSGPCPVHMNKDIEKIFFFFWWIRIILVLFCEYFFPKKVNVSYDLKTAWINKIKTPIFAEGLSSSTLPPKRFGKKVQNCKRNICQAMFSLVWEAIWMKESKHVTFCLCISSLLMVRDLWCVFINVYLKVKRCIYLLEIKT